MCYTIEREVPYEIRSPWVLCVFPGIGSCVNSDAVNPRPPVWTSETA